MSKFTKKQLVPVSETVDILWTLIEACHEMLRLFQEEQCAQAMGIAIDMRTLLEQMQGDVDENGNDKVASTLWKMYGNCLYSLGRILTWIQQVTAKNCHKAYNYNILCLT